MTPWRVKLQRLFKGATTVAEEQVNTTNRFDPFWHHGYVATPQTMGLGVQNYAYDTLGLVEFSPLGTGIYNRDQWRITVPAMYLPNKQIPSFGIGQHPFDSIDLTELLTNPDFMQNIGAP